MRKFCFVCLSSIFKFPSSPPVSEDIESRETEHVETVVKL